MKICLCNARLITMETAREPSKNLAEPGCLLIRNGIIEDVIYENANNCGGKLPPGELVIDCGGGYVLPAFIDMHVHLDSAATLPLYLARGIAVIRNMSGTQESLGLKKEIAAGKSQGPFIYNAGPILDGPSGKLARSIRLADPAVARQEAERQADLGYEYIKTYPDLPADTHRALAAAARSRGLKLVGHGSNSLTTAELIDEGYYTLEHASCLPDREEEIKALAESGLWHTPTLSILKDVEAMGVRGQGLERQKYRLYLSEEDLEVWQGLVEYYQTMPRFKSFDFRKLTGRAKSFRRYSSRLLVGTDAYIPFSLPGLSYHRELAFMQEELEMTPYEVLRAATINGAKCLGIDDQMGTITQGKKAELVVVERNPLEDIRQAGMLKGLLHQGCWYDDAVLAAMEAACRNQWPK